ncbi:SRPBCC family protein [Mucilaginibacter aquaedulcis]|uniref:SRPBCC family protein n=1 Tax=Mucilaginibacter aquaedulcis TaxID=1187081 RepID=UPI0025B60556|nr:SRPBCC domain-containing protein [Mucilaginibacter aquaedulcis]MDN3549496.1 SRPBCC domain-containing protein [Mucilaginibacter aquaedulcis]
MTTKTEITKDVANKKINVTRAFAAPVEKVWKAWTDSSILDKWWAPRPWRAETKSLDFKAGGLWLYAMIGPNGEKSWCRVDIKTVSPQQSFTSTARFCDEEGNPDASFPSMHWITQFSATVAGTNVDVEISFDNEVDLHKIVEMGFEQGFTMALGNLDEVLEA